MATVGIRVEERDRALLRGLFESRVMTTNHVAALHFGGSGEAAKKRLQKLKSAGFISVRPRRTFEPSIFFLTRKGLELLQEWGVLAEYPGFHLPVLDRRAKVSDLTIRHELEVMDVKTAFHIAIGQTPKFNVAKFSTWPLLHEFKAYRPGGNGVEILVRPDGFICIHESETDGSKYERIFFLEVDRSTESQDKLIARVGCYADYYRSGRFAVRRGGTREAYKEFPFRVVVVLKNAERRNNTAERLLQSAQLFPNQVYLTTFPEIIKDPLGPIWITPSNYRDVTQGTPFDPSLSRSSWGYKRQSSREILVEERIKKSALLS